MSENLADGEHILVAAPAKVHHDDLVFRHLRRPLDHLSQRMGGLERGDQIGPWLYSERVGRRMQEYAWA